MLNFENTMTLANESLNVFMVVPLALCILSFLIPKGLQRAYAIAGAIFFFALSCYEVSQGLGGQTLPWLSQFGIQLGFRLDSVSKWFVVLTGLVTFIAVYLKGNWYRKSPRIFVASSFFMAFALNAAFLSTNLITFYIAYEAVFVPIIFMVGIWGTQTKAASVFKFFLMSFLGSIMMLVSMFYLIYLYQSQTGQYSAQIFDLVQVSKSIAPERLCLAFFGFFLAFAIKVPLVPFHGWVRDAYVNAPMPATIYMSGILSKLGVFGFIRFVLPIFWDQAIQYHGILVTVAAISVLYAALLAIQSKNPRELLSYSSISHLGFVMLGIFSLTSGGVGAAVLLSVAHTLASVVLFMLLHFMSERKEDLTLDRFHGLAPRFPMLFVAFFIAVLASVSLPGTVNFVGEFLVLSFSYPVSALCTVLSSIGVILGTVYMFKFYQYLGFGSPNPKTGAESVAKDIGVFEISILIFMLGLIIYLGFQPAVILRGFSS
ncbi:MAG: NADH-quinone oxidoreductase subunit M [Bdellovibrionales bacterium]|nr:NADH-quinone oxidoreductase subunit M [Bdellovibrionales bacterium]